MLNHVAILIGQSEYCEESITSMFMMSGEFFRPVNASLEVCLENGIRVLTLLFSSSEVYKKLVNYFVLFKKGSDFLKELKERRIELRVIGQDISDLTNILTEESEVFDKEDSVLTLVLALNYSGRADIVQAVKNYAVDRDESGEIGSFDKVILETGLSTGGLPDLDLMIFVGGGSCIDNAFLWQSGYSEFFFTNVPWFNFQKKDLQTSIREFSRRQRRFGKTSEQVEACSLC